MATHLAESELTVNLNLNIVGPYSITLTSMVSEAKAQLAHRLNFVLFCLVFIVRGAVAQYHLSRFYVSLVRILTPSLYRNSKEIVGYSPVSGRWLPIEKL